MPVLRVVDDSATAREFLRRQLGNYDVRTASDGEEGVRAALDSRPALILMDVVMPKMDGLTACRTLRGIAAMAAVPIILVTSLDEEWDVEEGYRSGCTDYIAKPVDTAELLAKVETWLEATPASGSCP